MLKKLTVTVSASIASLKVKTTVVFVGTPVAPAAGTDKTRVGCACACHRQTSEPVKDRSPAKLAKGVEHLKFMT